MCITCNIVPRHHRNVDAVRADTSGLLRAVLRAVLRLRADVSFCEILASMVASWDAMASFSAVNASSSARSDGVKDIALRAVLLAVLRPVACTGAFHNRQRNVNNNCTGSSNNTSE